jgi:vacuolar-type H+-ATPase subunit I/STV1
VYCDKSEDCKIIESLKAKMYDLMSELALCKDNLKFKINTCKSLVHHLEKGRPACIDEAFQIGFENVKLRSEKENLVEEVDRLQQENEQIREANEQLRQTNNKLELDIEHTKRFWYDHMQEEKQLSNMRMNVLREALRKLSPYGRMSHPEAVCKFCNSQEYDGHTDDCEYMRLCKKEAE